MTEESPTRTGEDTVEQVDAKLARNAAEMEAIKDSLTGRAAAREEFRKRKGQPLEPHILDRGLALRLAYLESEQRRLALRKQQLAA